MWFFYFIQISRRDQIANRWAVGADGATMSIVHHSKTSSALKSVKINFVHVAVHTSQVALGSHSPGGWKMSKHLRNSAYCLNKFQNSARIFFFYSSNFQLLNRKTHQILSAQGWKTNNNLIQRGMRNKYKLSLLFFQNIRWILFQKNKRGKTTSFIFIVPHDPFVKEMVKVDFQLVIATVANISIVKTFRIDPAGWKKKKKKRR